MRTSLHASAPYTFTPPDKLQPSGKILDTVGKGPSWIAFSEDHSIIYSTDDATQALYAIKVGEVKPSVNAAGTKRAANLNSTLTVLDKASSGGDGPLSLAMHGHLLFIANYNNGSASVHELQDNGLFADKKPDRIFHFNREPKGSIGPISSRQDHSYAHQIIIEPSGQWAYVVDLGADKIHRLSVPPSGRGKDVKLVGQTSLATGTGPRHLAFHQEEGKTYAYLAAELETTVTAFQVSPVDGSLKAIGKPLYALPEGVAPGGNSTYGHLRTTSEIAVSPDGKFVYVGTRGDEVEDHISIFKRNADDGSIKFQEWALSGGRNLRHVSALSAVDFHAHADLFSVSLASASHSSPSLRTNRRVTSQLVTRLPRMSPFLHETSRPVPSQRLAQPRRTSEPSPLLALSPVQAAGTRRESKSLADQHHVMSCQSPFHQ